MSRTINIPASSGPGNAGVPTGADLIDGLLYWTTLENSASPSGSNATFLGYAITGQQIGSDLPYTEGAQSGKLRVYRANVNAYLQNGASGIRAGSGIFTISLPGTGTNGILLTEGAEPGCHLSRPVSRFSAQGGGHLRRFGNSGLLDDANREGFLRCGRRWQRFREKSCTTLFVENPAAGTIVRPLRRWAT